MFSEFAALYTVGVRSGNAQTGGLCMKRKNVIWCVAGVLIAASVAIVAKTVFGNAATTAAAGAGEASAAGAPMGSLAARILLLAALIALEVIAANSLVRLACDECWYRFDVVAHVVFVGAAVFGALLILEMLLGDSASFLSGIIGRLRAIDANAPIRFFAGVMVARLLYAVSLPIRLAWEEREDARETEETWA